MKNINKKRVCAFFEKNPSSYFLIKDVAKELGLSRPTVSKYVNILVAEGKLEIAKAFGVVNLYRLKSDGNGA